MRKFAQGPFVLLAACWRAARLLSLARLRWAILLAIAQQLLFTVDMAAIHQLSSSTSLFQIAFVRTLGGMALVLGLAAMAGGCNVFRTRHPWLQAARAASSVAYVLIMIISLAWMPLADATAISFLTGPYIVLLAGPILGEVVGLRRGIAVIVGLAGAAMIARPGFSGVSWVYLVVIAGTALNALAVVLTRYLRRDDSATTILLYVQLAQFVVFLPVAASQLQPFDFAQWPWMLVAAAAGPLGMYCGIVALLYAEASTLAPYAYLRLALAAGVAPAIFGEWPGTSSLVGSGIIIAACVAAAGEARWAEKRTASA